MKRDLLSFADLTRADADRLFTVAARLKADLRAGKRHQELAQKTLALIFHKPSLRTRLSFEVAMTLVCDKIHDPTAAYLVDNIRNLQ